MEEYLNPDKIVALALPVVKALAVLIIGMWVAKRVRSILKKTMHKKAVDPAISGFVSSLAYGLMVVFVVLAALGQMNVQTTGFVAVLGAAGLAVGLALQGSLSNFAAGVLLLIFRPFKIGDFVEAAGTSGVVENISIFTTEMKTGDNKKVIIPNSSIMGGIITNYSANDTRRVDLVMGIGYGDDIDHAKRVLEDVVHADERVLQDPAPTIAVVELADSSVNFVVRPWVKTADYWGAYFGLTEAVKKRFDAEGISIPYPQQDVHMHTVSDGNG